MQVCHWIVFTKLYTHDHSLSLLGYNKQTILPDYDCLNLRKRQIINHNQCAGRAAIFSLSPFYNPQCYGNRWRMLFPGPVTARCHSNRGDRADVISMGVPWLPWRQSVSTIRMFRLSRYTKTEHTPYKTITMLRLRRGEGVNNGTP